MISPVQLLLSIYVLLGFSGSACLPGPDSAEADKQEATTRVLSYNIHSAIGMNGVLSVERIIGILKKSKARIITLNELDRNYDSRSAYQDQVKQIADALDMDFVFQKTTWKAAIPGSGGKPREFGHAILSAYPIEQTFSEIYDAHGVHYAGLLGAEIKIDEQRLRVFLTHLDTDPAIRSNQITQALEWIGSSWKPTLLMGDLNAEPNDAGLKKILAGRTDAFADMPRAFTFKSNNPRIRIDYILGSGPIEFSHSRVIPTLASDHLPILSDITLNHNE